MNARSVSIGSATCILVLSLFMVPVHATGLYLDLPAYFSTVDTAGIELAVRHTDLQRVEGHASVFSAELALRPRQRIHARLVVHYPAVERGMNITNAVGDGIIHGTYRLTGDTLDVNGMFLRGYARLPLGPKRMPPFSYGSLDLGMGFEFRINTEMFRVRCRRFAFSPHLRFRELARCIGFPSPELFPPGSRIRCRCGGEHDLQLCGL